MITIHEKTATVFDTLGMGTLFPSSCFVSEELNGLFELEMMHPYDEKGKWKRLEVGNIVVASTPRGKQAFRVYRVQPTLDIISVYARHIFYDLLDNYISSCTVSAGTAQQVLEKLVSKFNYTMPFSFVSDLTGTNSFSVSGCNPVTAIMGDGMEQESIVVKFGGEVLRDNFNVTLKPSIGSDRGVSIKYGKNIVGMTVDEDTSEVVTRIFPFGKEELAGDVVDSPYILNYPYPKVAKVENLDCTTKEQLATYAQDLFDSGVDLPMVNIQVDFQLLSRTAEYKNYAPLEEVFLGDIVTIINQKMNFAKRARVISYEWDCLLEKYNEVELGDFMPTLASSVTSGVRSGSLASEAAVGASAVSAALQAHLNDFNNPHKTPTGGGSGTDDADAVLELLVEHEEDKNNPHEVTLAQVGFTIGSDIPDNLNGNDGDLYLQKENIIYTELEYARSDGSLYVDTKHKPTSATRIVMGLKGLPADGTYASPFGSRTSAGASDAFAFFVDSGTAYRSDYGGTGKSFNVSYSDELTINHNKNITSLNNERIVVNDTKTFSSSLSMFLFACNTGGSAQFKCDIDFLFCMIFENDTLIRDYIPVRDAHNIVCLYDKVTCEYYYAVGGEFIAGPDKNNTQEGSLWLKQNGTWTQVLKGA